MEHSENGTTSMMKQQAAGKEKNKTNQLEKRNEKKARPDSMRLTMAAFCITLNFVGAYLALCLKLPIYLDSIGTILAGAVLGPWYGMAVAMGSGLISGVTSDIYAIYFMPAGMITGFVAGFLFRTRLFDKKRMPIGTAFITLPGTAASASISAFLFHGVTSSGSSILVQMLSHLGCSMVVSAFVVQIVTEYADRFLSVALVLVLWACMTTDMKARLKGGQSHGTV